MSVIQSMVSAYKAMNSRFLLFDSDQRSYSQMFPKCTIMMWQVKRRNDVTIRLFSFQCLISNNFSNKGTYPDVLKFRSCMLMLAILSQ